MKNNKMYNELNNLKTPCYVIDKERFSSNHSRIENAFKKFWGDKVLMGYSIKTNHSALLLNMAKECGMCAEAVSDDEYNWAIQCGYEQDNIIFNGPQKSSELLIDSLKKGSIVNLDNIEDVNILVKESAQFKQFGIRVGLRVNFDLEKECPGETTAGHEVSRFGFCVENGELQEAILKLQTMGIMVKGLHMHYSSKSRSLNIFKALARKAADIVCDYQLETQIEYIDIGGGFFMGEPGMATGKPEMEDYAKEITEELNRVMNPKRVTLIIEPGASLIATTVNYLSKVINERNIRGVRILTIDGSDLHVNPFMAHRQPVYRVLTKDNEREKCKEKQIICGATCMENDRLAVVQEGFMMGKGDYIYCSCAGAYTMGFNSCFINLPPYIYVKDKEEYHLVRKKDEEALFYA